MGWHGAARAVQHTLQIFDLQQYLIKEKQLDLKVLNPKCMEPLQYIFFLNIGIDKLYRVGPLITDLHRLAPPLCPKNEKKIKIKKINKNI